MLAKDGDPGFVSLSEVMQIQRDRSAALVDARSKEEFSAGHIPGARHLPFYEMDTMQEKALEGLLASTDVARRQQRLRNLRPAHAAAASRRLEDGPGIDGRAELREPVGHLLDAADRRQVRW